MQRSAESSSGNARSAQRRSSTPSSEISIQSWIVHTQYRLIPAAAGPTRSGRSRVRARAIAAYEASLTVGHHAAYAESRASSSSSRYRSSRLAPGTRSWLAIASRRRRQRLTVCRGAPGLVGRRRRCSPGPVGVGRSAGQPVTGQLGGQLVVGEQRAQPRVGLEGVGDLRVQPGPLSAAAR